MKKLLLLAFAAFLGVFSLSGEETSALTGKFPAELINASGKKVSTASALQGKIVAIYFSAHWCGPCRAFTPQLAKFYKKVSKKQNVEIIFVSRDKSDSDMMKYMKSMPWLAIPFADAEFRDNLSREFKVRGIPSLIVLNEKGEMISSNARWDVVLLGEKAVNAWKKEDYKPMTYNDYKTQKASSKKKRKK